jgi:hypothetical protein
MFFEKAILLAYCTTVVSETVVIVALQRAVNMWQWIIAILLINSLTHPLVIYFLYIQNTPYVLVELGAFVVEMFWYKLVFTLSWKRSALISGVANISSVFAGVIIRFLLGL